MSRNDREAEVMSDEVMRLRADVEQLQVQLAACGVAAMGYGDDCKPGDYGWSASLGDVLALRKQCNAAAAATV